MPYTKQDNPFVVPTTDNKLIEEHYGMATTGDKGFSIAHMIAPAGWSEPYQYPQFDEVTIVISGRKQFEVDDDVVVLNAGESILIRKGSKVKYGNPFDEPCEYWSCCVPAFTLESANRES
jgi:mannose-6-phosphate isomerase-like protein (cupin superfamily)